MSAASIRSELPRFDARLRLASGPGVSPFCIGVIHEPRVIVEAFDRGINFFFVSVDMHWPLYEQTRRGLAELFAARPAARDGVVVAAVAYVAQPEFTIAPFHELLGAVPGLERIDVAVIGGVCGDESARFAAFAPRRREGRVPGVCAIGATFHSRGAALRCIQGRDVDVSFVRYNAAHRSAEHDLFPHLPRGPRPPLFTFKSTSGFVDPDRFDALGFAANAWRPEVSDHYRFVLGRPEVDGILCAPTSVAELVALERAIARGPLTPAETKYLKCAADLALGRIPRMRAAPPAA